MAWTYLSIAGLLEIAWAIGLKYTAGWTKLYPSLLTAAAMIASFYFLSLAVKRCLSGQPMLCGQA
jgi:quaternary ammonium compound-resistance protein SugE